MWKRFLSIILITTIFFSNINFARADDSVVLPDIVTSSPGEKDVGTVISSLKKGEKALFSGVLLSPAAVATIIAQIHSFDNQLKIEVERAKSEKSAQCTFLLSEQKVTSDTDKKILQARLDANQKILLASEEALRKEQSTKANTPIFIGAGVIGGVGLTLLTIFTISRVSSK